MTDLADVCERKDMTSPRGRMTALWTRLDTSDQAVVWSTFGGAADEYLMVGRTINDWAIDIGAHIGTVGLAVLADNPLAHVIFVEPLADNVALINRSLVANGWADRAIVVHGALAVGETTDIGYGYGSTEYGHTNRYIGGLADQMEHETYVSERVRAYSLSDLVEMADGPIDFVKTDCEGCEWVWLTDPAVAECASIVGEYHGSPEQAGLHALLDATHDVRFWSVAGPNGLFEAVRR